MNLFGANWRTTSLGVLTIAGSIVNLVFAIRKGLADEALWMVAITNILTGVGLIFSRDSTASARDKANTTDKIADLQNQVTAVKGDTSQITKTQ